MHPHTQTHTYTHTTTQTFIVLISVYLIRGITLINKVELDRTFWADAHLLATHKDMQEQNKNTIMSV